MSHNSFQRVAFPKTNNVFGSLHRALTLDFIEELSSLLNPLLFHGWLLLHPNIMIDLFLQVFDLFILLQDWDSMADRRLTWSWFQNLFFRWNRSHMRFSLMKACVISHNLWSKQFLILYLTSLCCCCLAAHLVQKSIVKN